MGLSNGDVQGLGNFNFNAQGKIFVAEEKPMKWDEKKNMGRIMETNAKVASGRRTRALGG